MTAREALSDEEVVHLGQQASEALNNPIFRIIYDVLVNRYYREWQNLSPEHTKAAAHLQTKHIVLKEIVSDMTSLVTQAERRLAEMQQANSPEAQEKRRLDTQGFGLNYGGTPQ
jgi:hypothetical protein